MKKFIVKHHWLGFALLLSAALLGGCATDKTGPQSLSPICEALGEPFIYNSKNPKSDYHAGPKLAPRLATQNRVGVNLRCPVYK